MQHELLFMGGNMRRHYLKLLVCLAGVVGILGAVSAAAVSFATISVASAVTFGLLFSAAGAFSAVIGRADTSKIYAAPGTTAVKLLQFILPKRSYDEVFAQVIADTRAEYFSALAEGNKTKARWIRIRDSINLAIVFVQFLIAACLDRGVKIYKAFSSK